MAGEWGSCFECLLPELSIEGVEVVACELVQGPAHDVGRIGVQFVIGDELANQLRQGRLTKDQVAAVVGVQLADFYDLDFADGYLEGCGCVSGSKGALVDAVDGPCKHPFDGG